MKHRFLLYPLALLILALCTASTSANSTNESCVVSISVTRQSNDPFLPWQKRQPETGRGIGIAISPTHLLVPEPLVRRTTLIEMQRAREGKRVAVSLVHADIQAGLALLSCPSNALDGVQQPPFADTLLVNAGVELVKLDETREPEQGDGRVIRALMDNMSGSPYAGFVMKVQTDMHTESPGAAVLQDNMLVGMVLNYDSNERAAQIIPIQAIRPFVEQVLANNYRGMASAGVIWQPLIDPVKRNYLGVGSRPGGVLINATLPGLRAGEVLEPDDVLISWNGVPIDDLGFFLHPDYGRLRYSFLIRNNTFPGDVAEVEVVRGGKLKALSLTLERFDDNASLIPENSEDTPDPYIVEGGFLLRELTGRFIQAHGPNWKTHLDSRIAHTYLAKRLAPDQPGDRVVILHRVLPDEINIGYQHFSYVPVEAINGKPIRNIADAIRIREEEGHIHTLRLQAYAVPLALAVDELDAANARISQNYQIPALIRPPEAPPSPQLVKETISYGPAIPEK